MSDTNTICLRTSDEQVFHVDRKYVGCSKMLSSLLEETDDSAEIPLPSVTAAPLAKVLEYCKRIVDQPTMDEAASKEYDDKFVDVEQRLLFDIFLVRVWSDPRVGSVWPPELTGFPSQAANYLNIDPILDAAAEGVAALMRGKSPEEIRQTFGIINDFTAEEEEEIRRENQWAFE